MSDDTYEKRIKYFTEELGEELETQQKKIETSSRGYDLVLKKITPFTHYFILFIIILLTLTSLKPKFVMIETNIGEWNLSFKKLILSTIVIFSIVVFSYFIYLYRMK